MKILVADDHTLFRDGLQHILPALAPQVDLRVAGDYAGAAALLAQHGDADLALVDLDMPGREAHGGLEGLIALAPTLPLVVLSACEERGKIRRILDAGAMGFIPKREKAEVMLAALRLVLSGGVYVPPLLLDAAPPGPAEAGLTPRQAEVLRCLEEGHPNKVIARRLGMTEATVKAHVGAILRNLDVTNRAQAVRTAHRLGLLASR